MRWYLALFSCGGLAVGLAGGLWIGSSFADGSPARAEQSPTVTTGLVAVEQQPPNVALPARIIAPYTLEESREPAGVDATDVAQQQDAGEFDIVAQHANRIASHFSDARDATWAAASEASFRVDFAPEHGELGRTVTLIGIDCRMTSCVATVEWSSREKANKAWRGLLHANYTLPCATQVVVPETADPQEPVRAQLWLDCTDARADG